MPKCIACDVELRLSSEIIRGYCDVCQLHIRTVFDKDAFALGQYQKTPDGDLVNTLEWTTIIEVEEDKNGN